MIDCLLTDLGLEGEVRAIPRRALFVLFDQSKGQGKEKGNTEVPVNSMGPRGATRNKTVLLLRKILVDW